VLKEAAIAEELLPMFDSESNEIIRCLRTMNKLPIVKIFYQ
jgi:hypothetical protein